ncbi:MAG: hypothetical protein C4289_00585 [Chloroflexota bacterium]
MPSTDGNTEANPCHPLVEYPWLAARRWRALLSRRAARFFRLVSWPRARRWAMLRLFRLAVLSAVSTYALIVLGGITRVTGSGLGCEDDWPLCQGKPYPPLNTLAIIEYLHRTVAAYIGILVFAVMIGTWRARDLRTRTRAIATSAFVLVIVQGLLGAVTVWWELPPEIVTAHLGAAILFFGTTLSSRWIAVLQRGLPAANRFPWRSDRSSGLRERPRC